MKEIKRIEAYESKKYVRGSFKWAKFVWENNPELSEREKILALTSVLGYYKALEYYLSLTEN